MGRTVEDLEREVALLRQLVEAKDTLIAQLAPTIGAQLVGVVRPISLVPVAPFPAQPWPYNPPMYGPFPGTTCDTLLPAPVERVLHWPAL